MVLALQPSPKWDWETIQHYSGSKYKSQVRTDSPQYTELNVVAESAQLFRNEKKTKEDENPVF